MTRLRLPAALLLLASLRLVAQGPAAAPGPRVFGFRDFTTQARWDAEFLAVPSADRARQELERLTAAPHWASSPEDYSTAQFVAGRFREAGLETTIVPYNVWMNRPVSVSIEAFNASGRRIFTGPTRERLPTGGTFTAFNGSTPGGDVTAEVVYANYGKEADFETLERMGVSIQGKIVLVRNGAIFRGVKVYLAERYGAKAVLIYSDPEDEGREIGPTYPDGPYRPDSAAQSGSVQFLPVYSGDPTTPGIASTPGLPASQRIPAGSHAPGQEGDQPSIPVHPLSAADALPILRALGGEQVPPDWQGGFTFPYHVGGPARPVRVHLRLVEDARLRTIWDVIGIIPGADEPGTWVIAGNHRDAWVYGAADPGSGTAAMLEVVRGLGALLRQGWRPRRTIVVASWDAEEEGLVGSTEWAEQHPSEMARAAAYLNTDIAVSGPAFHASAVPSLRQFVQDVAREVPSPEGGTVLEHWRKELGFVERVPPSGEDSAGTARVDWEARIGELGSGSDYTPFLQHFGVPATDIGSDGPFGVYHTVYDNFDWFSRFADPGFRYTQQQARVFGLEILHMADADVLPYDYRVYADEILRYLERAQSRARAAGMMLDFHGAIAAAGRFEAAGARVQVRQLGGAQSEAVSGDRMSVASDRALNAALSSAERALLIPGGLPGRPWYRHSIYAPGELTGYAAVMIPGVNEAIAERDDERAQAQLRTLEAALARAAAALEAGAR